MYQTDAFWQQYGKSPDYRERAAVVQDLIPLHAQRILDVGCGSGDMLRAIAATHGSRLAVGCDASAAACSRTPQPVVCAALPDLPFPDRTFDVVLCCEVLEHLDDAAHAAALGELERLARQYVVIGVPYRENLRTKQVLCASCRRTSHADGHVRSYSRGDLRNLFMTFTLRRIVLVGVRKKRQSGIGSWLNQRFGGRHYHPELFSCPHCGSNRFIERQPVVPPLAEKIIAAADNFLTACAVPAPYWIIGIYERCKR